MTFLDRFLVFGAVWVFAAMAVTTLLACTAEKPSPPPDVQRISDEDFAALQRYVFRGVRINKMERDYRFIASDMSLDFLLHRLATMRVENGFILDGVFDEAESSFGY
jgi:hypothetical protein